MPGESFLRTPQPAFVFPPSPSRVTVCYSSPLPVATGAVALEQDARRRLRRAIASAQVDGEVKIDVLAEGQLQREAVVVAGGEEACMALGEDPLFLGLEGGELVADGVDRCHLILCSLDARRRFILPSDFMPHM